VVSAESCSNEPVLFFPSLKADCFFNLRAKKRRREGLPVSMSSVAGDDSGLTFGFVRDLRLCDDSDFERFKFFFEDFLVSFSVLTIVLIVSSVVVVEEVSGRTSYK
jgi:hypothetical protein